MALATVLGNLTTRIATECKSLRTLINNNAADLSALTTTAKTNLVAAINELDAAIAAVEGSVGASINDSSTTSTTESWSASKIVSAISTAKNEILGGAGAAYDTLMELQTLLEGDAASITTINTALANRVRFDASQTLSAAQQLQACQNIGIGDPETDLVSAFNSAL